MSALRRRWKIVISGLLITAVAGLLALRILPPTYQATGSVVFIPPSVTTDPSSRTGVQGTNPFLDFGSPLAATAEVVSASVNSDASAKSLKARGASGTYQVALDPNSDAPLVSVEATARNAKSAIQTRDLVVAAVQRKLLEIQRSAGSPANQFVRAQTVTMSDTAPRVHGSLIRALAVIVIVGVVLSCGAALVVEGLRRGRQSRSTSTDVERWQVGVDAAKTPIDIDHTSMADEEFHPMPLAARPSDS